MSPIFDSIKAWYIKIRMKTDRMKKVAGYFYQSTYFTVADYENGWV